MRILGTPERSSGSRISKGKLGKTGKRMAAGTAAAIIGADGAWYYLDPNGAMIHDTTMDIDGVSYTFDSNGVMVEPIS